MLCWYKYWINIVAFVSTVLLVAFTFTLRLWSFSSLLHDAIKERALIAAAVVAATVFVDKTFIQFGFFSLLLNVCTNERRLIKYE